MRSYIVARWYLSIWRFPLFLLFLPLLPKQHSMPSLAFDFLTRQDSRERGRKRTQLHHMIHQLLLGMSCGNTGKEAPLLQLARPLFLEIPSIDQRPMFQLHSFKVHSLDTSVRWKKIWSVDLSWYDFYNMGAMVGRSFRKKKYREFRTNHVSGPDASWCDSASSRVRD